MYTVIGDTMKKYIIIIVLFFILLVILTSCQNKNLRKSKENQEKRAIFISYIELKKYIKGNDIETAKKNIDKMINNIDKFNFNMIILQVRSFSDSIYESSVFPWSLTVSKEEGISPGFDILNYFIDKSHEKNIELHAWINPYRIRNTNNTSDISTKNIAYSLLNTDDVLVSDDGIYYNPSSQKVEDLITNGVEEIVKKYDVDGIHFDDYFYPNNKTIDLNNYNKYIKENENVSIDEYRLMVVNNLIERVHLVTKKYNVLFGISPDGNIENNYNKNYADIYKWGSSNKYVDYIMPQIYYGFNNEAKPFFKTLKTWEEVVKESDVEILPALAFYKVDQIDSYAKGGSEEWINYDDIIMRQVILSRNIKNYNGFSIFRYDSIFSEEEKSQTVMNEVKNLKKIISK